MAQQHVPDTWEQGRAYERYVGRWSREVAPRFLDWLRVPPGLRWLDVGCGTGALSAAILDTCAPASVDGVEPSEGFLETAVAELGNRVTFHRADASALPLDDASVDVVVSGLVLNFVPDLDTALAEMSRVAVAGGVVGALRLGLRRSDGAHALVLAGRRSSSTRRRRARRGGAVRRLHARGPHLALRERRPRRRGGGLGRGADEVRGLRRLLGAVPRRPGRRPGLRHVARRVGRDRLRERLRELVPTGPTARSSSSRGRGPCAGS